MPIVIFPEASAGGDSSVLQNSGYGTYLGVTGEDIAANSFVGISNDDNKVYNYEVDKISFRPEYDTNIDYSDRLSRKFKCEMGTKVVVITILRKMSSGESQNDDQERIKYSVYDKATGVLLNEDNGINLSLHFPQNAYDPINVDVFDCTVLSSTSLIITYKVLEYDEYGSSDGSSFYVVLFQLSTNTLTYRNYKYLSSG